MSENIPSWFIKKYTDTVDMLAQQRTKRVAQYTSGGGTFIGSQVFFPRMGAVEMYDSTRFAEIAMANAQMDMVSVTANPKFVVMGVWDPDKTKLNINLAAEYGRASAMAGFRAEDNMVITALNSAAANGVVGTNADGTTNTANIFTLGDYNTIADLDVWSAAVAQLGTQEKFEGEELCAVVPFKVKVNNSLDPYMALNNVKNNNVWDDINWTTFQRLNDQAGAPITQATDAATTGVDMFLFCRSAVSSDYNNEMTTINERVGGRLTDLIGNWFQAGAVVKEAAGVVRVKSKYNFALARKAIPIADLGPN
jgi:hypothetical protein